MRAPRPHLKLPPVAAGGRHGQRRHAVGERGTGVWRGGGGEGTQKKRVWREHVENTHQAKQKVIKLCVVRPRANPAGDGEGLPRRRCALTMAAGAPLWRAASP